MSKAISGLQMKQKDDEAIVYIYDEIGPARYGMIDATSVVQAVPHSMKLKNIHVRLNTPGGSVFEAAAIFNHLVEHDAKVRVSVDGVAASAGSVIAMAGDEIEIADNALMMIHNAWLFAMGNKAELLKAIELLDKVDGQITVAYAKRTGNTEEQIRQWMEDETWFTADEAVKNKFADRKSGSVQNVAVRLPANRFRNVPEQLKQRATATPDRFTFASADQPFGPEPKETLAAPPASNAAASIAARLRIKRQEISR